MNKGRQRTERTRAGRKSNTESAEVPETIKRSPNPAEAAVPERSRRDATMKNGWQMKTLGEVLEKTETVKGVNPYISAFLRVDARPRG